MDPIREHMQAMTRRQFFGQSAAGPRHRRPGVAAARASRGARRTAAATAACRACPHFAPKAKRAIYLFMSGAPSQIDLFDYKPTHGRAGSTRTCPSRSAWASGSRP